MSVLRVVVIGAVVLAALSVGPAMGHPVGQGGSRLVFEAAVPCGVACPQFLPGAGTACSTPFPPGSFDSFVSAPAPTPPPGMVVILEATIDPPSIAISTSVRSTAVNWQAECTRLANRAKTLSGLSLRPTSAVMRT